MKRDFPVRLVGSPRAEVEIDKPQQPKKYSEEDMREEAKFVTRLQRSMETDSLEYQIAQGRFEAHFEEFAEQVRLLSLSAFPNSSQERIEFAVSLLVSNLSHLMERLALDQAKLFDR